MATIACAARLVGCHDRTELAAEVQRRNPAVPDDRMHMILKPLKRVDLANVVRSVLDERGFRA
jgi:hypothetical protein